MEKITRKEAHDIYGWLNEKNIVKFDKETRKAIISICRALKPVATEYEESRKAAHEKIFADQKEALEKRGKAFADYQTATTNEEKKKQIDLIYGFVELTPLDKEFAEYVAELDKEEVEIDVPKMEEDKFVDGCEAAGIALSVSLLDEIAFLFSDKDK